MAKKINMFPPIPEPPYQMSDADIPAELFEPLPEEDRHTDQINRPSISYWQSAFSKIKADKLAVIGFIIIFFMILLAVFGPIISPYTYEQQDYEAIYQSPNAQHWLGTDMFGRDQFTRISYGARISLTIGFVAALVNMVIGSLYGGIAGFFAGLHYRSDIFFKCRHPGFRTRSRISFSNAGSKTSRTRSRISCRVSSACSDAHPAD